MAQETQSYKDEIYALLDNYVEGRNVFRNAKDWDHPVTVKPGVDDPTLPQSWLELADRVIGIVAHKKYKLDTYPNVIEIVDYEQMLDMMAVSGMVDADHWSVGKKRGSLEKSYDEGHSGLPYEMIVNANPAVAYCMSNNTPMMQMLVIAHASYGHNSFFKNNEFFKEFTDAESIFSTLMRHKKYVRECEEKYGVQRVEQLLDSCHALWGHAIDRYRKPRPKTPDEEKARRARIEESRLRAVDLDTDWTLKEKTATEAFNESAKKSIVPPGGEENILRFVASYAPHLEEWEREIIRGFCDKQQYFYPQILTKTMNEGWASYWHYKILYDLYELGLMSDGMMIDFFKSHSGVTRQPGHDEPGFHGFNPYALGIAIFFDIERMCFEPTAEDYEWFPRIAGRSENWLEIMNEAKDGFKDETFILQYLSPKVMRDFHIFSVRDDDREKDLIVDAIHNERGYRAVREAVAAERDFGFTIPDIVVDDYNYKGDRTLILKHVIHDRRPLADDKVQKVLAHLHRLWGHPVVINSVGEENKIEKSFKYPADPVPRLPFPVPPQYPVRRP